MDRPSVASATSPRCVSPLPFESSCLAERPQVTDDEGTAWTEFVKEGDKIKAIITEINAETKKVSLGLKPSLFPDGAPSLHPPLQPGG